MDLSSPELRHAEALRGSQSAGQPRPQPRSPPLSLSSQLSAWQHRPPCQSHDASPRSPPTTPGIFKQKAACVTPPCTASSLWLLGLHGVGRTPGVAFRAPFPQAGPTGVSIRMAPSFKASGSRATTPTLEASRARGRAETEAPSPRASRLLPLSVGHQLKCQRLPPRILMVTSSPDRSAPLPGIPTW